MDIEKAEQYWRGRSVLVTGADGFIGGALAITLAELGAKTTAVVRDARPLPPPRDVLGQAHMFESVMPGDIGDEAFVRRAFASSDPELVFHLAAEALVPVAHRNPIETMRTNVLGTVHVMDYALRDRAAVIMASSDKALGHQTTFPIPEHASPKPQHPYDASKAAAEIVMQTYVEHYGLEAYGTRFANVYGYGDTNWSRLVPGVMRDILVDRPPVLRSDGTPVREFIFINDAVTAYLMLAQARTDILIKTGETSGTFTISAGIRKSVGEVVADIAGVCETVFSKKARDPIHTSKAVGEEDRIELEEGRFKELTGWTPECEWMDGLERTRNWLMQYLWRASVSED